MHEIEVFGFSEGGRGGLSGGLGDWGGSETSEIRGGLAGDGVLLAEGGEALDEVAEVVGEFVVISVLKFFPGEIGIREGVDVTEEEVAEGVEAVAVEDFYRIDDVAEAFAHLLTAGEDVAVGDNAAREGQTEAEQDGGPGDSVEAEDVFADELGGGGPEISDGLVGVAEDGKVVGESVDPDVHDLSVVARDGYTPSELLAGAGDGDVGGVLQKTEDFLLTEFGEDGEFAGEDFGADLVFEVGDTEVVILFGEALVGFLVVGADAVMLVVFLLGNEAFAAFAIPAVVLGGVDMGAEFFPDGLAAADVVGVGGADEVGVGDLEALDEVAELSGVLVGVGLGGETGLGGFAEDFVAVLVGANLEADFVALAATEAGVGVGEQVIHGVADVGVTVDVGDCSSDISFGHGDIITRTGGESEGAGEAGRSKKPAERAGFVCYGDGDYSTVQVAPA